MLRTFFVIACSFLLLFAFQDCKKITPTHLKGCFTINPPTDSVFQTITFTNCSKGATLWHWYFGDGDSDIFNFSTTHSYQIPGYYTVTLVTLDEFGDSNVVSQGLIVKALSSAYTGTFGGYDACSLTGVDSTVITISSVSDTIVSIYNLYNTGKTFVADAEGFTLVVPPQTFNNGSGNMLIQGSIQLMGDTTTEVFNSLTLSIIVTGFSTRDVCQSTLYK
jgi:PKD repeat protein